MSSDNAPKVLVVGAGPAGLILALSLLKNGIPVRIIEKNTQHHVSERGSGISCRTLEVELFLGVGNDVLNTGFDAPIMQIHDPKDPYRIVKTFPMLEKIDPTPAFPVTRAVMLGQCIHQQIIRKHLEALGCQVELGTTLSGLEQSEDGVTVRLTKTTTNGEQVEETAKFAYVVGADGARSAVRKQMGADFVGESRDFRVYLIDARIEGVQDDKLDFHRWGDGVKNVVSLRHSVREGIFQLLLAGENIDFDTVTKGTPEAIQAEFHKLSGRTDFKVTEVISHGEWRPNMRIADRFRDGRVFIVGDAAHVHPPTGGQGLNTSVQDSFNLAWKLALVIKNQSPPSLLDSYEHERMPVIVEMLQLTTDIFNKMSSRVETLKALKDAKDAKDSSTLSTNQESTMKRGWTFTQLGINYRWSEVVFDERFAKVEGKEKEKKEAYGKRGYDVRAGDRAPDAPGLDTLLNAKEGEKVTRLFEVFNPSTHTALIFTSNPSDATTREVLDSMTKLHSGLVRTSLILPKDSSYTAKDISSPGIDFVFKDTEGHAYTGYGINGNGELEKATTVVIVRPDAVVGAFAMSKAGVDRYLSTVFSSG
ncbi:uncharacterized protein FOMMEDRAFT_126912 [Fomitiporia mediterranea MF3/22]|uniref:uncharacterized protein n=1 Tax=Fomitiporia mediterranea (strain MF3/22) TaxID=694068 RepID=UPI0004407F9B|nr:uncharacterized protein FOMMEDRAFT_126912 [Fomitiporia mediterranea MF3/22]EJD01753.1 hypothetical protein FOMMEDRAFT_126912 [Fomitiporia mediterranea MF3/22]